MLSFFNFSHSWSHFYCSILFAEGIPTCDINNNKCGAISECADAAGFFPKTLTKHVLKDAHKALSLSWQRRFCLDWFEVYQYWTYSDRLRRSHNQLSFSTVVSNSHLIKYLLTKTQHGRNDKGTDNPDHFYRNTCYGGPRHSLSSRAFFRTITTITVPVACTRVATAACCGFDNSAYFWYSAKIPLACFWWQSNTLFFYKNVVFSGPGWIYLFFCRFQVENVPVLFLNYSLWHFCFRIYWSISYKCLVSRSVSVTWTYIVDVQSARSRCHVKRHLAVSHRYSAIYRKTKRIICL